ncbi:hypothetical protein J6590_083641 [Homalodisca vitripennis]|nr:hypothetical protein J6590_083641 [Homalodisca vitripennis]
MNSTSQTERLCYVVTLLYEPLRLKYYVICGQSIGKSNFFTCVVLATDIQDIAAVTVLCILFQDRNRQDIAAVSHSVFCSRIEVAQSCVVLATDRQDIAAVTVFCILFQDRNWILLLSQYSVFCSRIEVAYTCVVLATDRQDIAAVSHSVFCSRIEVAQTCVVLATDRQDISAVSHSVFCSKIERLLCL